MSSLHIGYGADERRVSITAKQRQTHSHIIGSSGSGKSKFLECLIRGDLRNRQGFCLIDPHGELYENVLSYCAHFPASVPKDIILLNLSKPDSIIGFNPFEKAEQGDVSVQVDLRIAATMHAWNEENTDLKPTLARMLKLIYTAMVELNLGLPQAQHLIDFNAKQIRAHLVEQIKSPLIKKEWRELQGLDVKEWRNEVLSVKNRLFRFLTSTTLARFMGVPGRSINLSEVMNEGKVLLVNLAPSDDLSPENARAFGSLLVNDFFECARRRRSDAQGRPPKPYYLYLDEFQNFVSLDLTKMLAEVRKFGLFLIMAHQGFSQLDDKLASAILTNCGIKAVFGGLEVRDARRMAEELFIGQLDPKRIKVAIYQTKFWPKYSRDKVYSRGTSHTSTTATTSSAASGAFNAAASGMFFQPSDWIAGYGNMAGSNESLSAGSSSLSGNSNSSADSHGDTESEADIPILLPVPFEELSSVQYYSTEEQLIELTAALKKQFQRHCFIELPEEKTQPLLVPFVQEYTTSRGNRKWFEDKLAVKQQALSGKEADELIAAQEQKLFSSAAVDAERLVEVIPPEKSAQKPKVRAKKRAASANPFDKIADGLDGLVGKE